MAPIHVAAPGMYPVVHSMEAAHVNDGPAGLGLAPYRHMVAHVAAVLDEVKGLVNGAAGMGLVGIELVEI